MSTNFSKIQMIAVGCLTTTVLAGFLPVDRANARDMVGWMVQGNGSGIIDGQMYTLYNTDQRKSLAYEERRGANFGWKNSNRGAKIQRMSGGSTPLKCGEKFALFIDQEWAIYGSQTRGINLTSRTKLNSNDYYQWKFSCPSGQVVPLNDRVTLVNLKANDSLVGCKRVFGVNMCWASDTVTVLGDNWRRADAPGTPLFYRGY